MQDAKKTVAIFLVLFATLGASVSGCAHRGKPSLSREASADGPASRGPAVLRVLIKAPEFTRGPAASIEYALEGGTPEGPSPERVSLWTTTDDGATWTFQGETRDLGAPFELRTPDGTYGLWMEASLPGGAPVEGPRPGDAPRAKLVVDSAPPDVEVGAMRAVRAKDGAGMIAIEAPLAVRDTNPAPGSLQAEWRMMTGRWKSLPVGAEDVRKGLFVFQIPEPSRDPISLRFTVSDLAGNTTRRVFPCHPLDLLDPPILEIVSPSGGGAFGGGQTVEVRTRAEWDRVAQGGISLAASTDGGRTWQPVASGIEGTATVSWTVPATNATEALLELSARSTCGYLASVRTAPFKVDSQPPSARILGPRYSTGKTIRLSVSASDAGPAGLDRLAVYRAEPGGEPRKVKESPPADSIEIEADRQGPAGLWLVAVDKAGNSSPVPARGDEPAFTVDVDPREPSIALRSFAGGGVFRGGANLYIFIDGEASLQDRPMAIYLSEGSDGPWQPIAEGIAFRERYLWRLPEVTGTAFRLKVEVQDRGGGVARSVSAIPFAIDAAPPEAAVRSAEAIGPGRARIRFAASDGPAGVARVWIWHRPAEDAAGGPPVRWESWPVPEANLAEGPEGSAEIDLPPGRHLLFATAEDRMGNAGSPPEGPEHAQTRIEVPAAVSPPPSPPEGTVPSADPSTAAGPRFRLENFHGGTYRGGDRRYVFWKIEGADPGTTVDILSTSDGGSTWSDLVQGVSAEGGRWAWTLPREPGTVRKLRLEVRANVRGQDLRARSESDIVIESRTPRAEVLGPHASRSTRTGIRFALLPPGVTGDAAGIAPAPVVRIECHVQRAGEAGWTLAGRLSLDADAAGGIEPPAIGAGGEPDGTGIREAPEGSFLTGTVPASIEDGLHEVFLVPVDAVGNRPSLPEVGDVDPSRRILVDTVRPRLDVAAPGRKDLYEGGELVAIRIRAEDENLGDYPVRIEARGPGGGVRISDPEGHDPEGDWSVLEPRFPREGTYSYRVPSDEGARSIRVIATDIAGNRAEAAVDLRIAPGAPRIRLVSPPKTAVRAGSPVAIRWEGRGIEPADTGISLRSSIDGGKSWSEIASGLPMSGVYTWTAPGEDITDLRIRAEGVGSGRQPASAESAVTVSFRIPKVVLEAIEPDVSPVGIHHGGTEDTEDTEKEGFRP